jgi:hypothetical protein
VAPEIASSEDTLVQDFVPRTIELHGGFTLRAPIARVFPLFSPLGERSWVPDWEPELLDPFGASWERGQVFRTAEGGREAVWLVTLLNPASYEVEYHRVCSGRYVARVAVHCRAEPDDATGVNVSYRFVGLSSEGNAEIEIMTPEAYAQKMERWKEWIETRALADV